MAKASRHVIANLKGGWSVRQYGAARATRVFATQEDAVKFGRNLAKKEGTEFYVHRAHGTVRRKDSYVAESS